MPLQCLEGSTRMLWCTQTTKFSWGFPSWSWAVLEDIRKEMNRRGMSNCNILITSFRLMVLRPMLWTYSHFSSNFLKLCVSVYFFGQRQVRSPVCTLRILESSGRRKSTNREENTGQWCASVNLQRRSTARLQSVKESQLNCPVASGR